ncbi:MAG: Imm17 family immunity protein [Oscillospiraceae bacterium]
MDSEKITAFFQEHWYFVTLIVGVVILIGALINWNWLCNPTGAPHSHRYGRGSRRAIFFLLGVLQIAVEYLGLLLAL